MASRVSQYEQGLMITLFFDGKANRFRVPEDRTNATSAEIAAQGHYLDLSQPFCAGLNRY
jgi:hypothetical protein